MDHPALPVSKHLSVTEGHVTVHSHLMISIQQVSYNHRHVFCNVSEVRMTIHFKSKRSHCFVLRKGSVQRLERYPRNLIYSFFWDVKPCNIPDYKRPELNSLRSMKSHQRIFLKNSLLEIFYFMPSVLSPVLSSKAVVYYHTWLTQTPLTAEEINTHTTNLLMLRVWTGNKRPTTYASVI